MCIFIGLVATSSIFEIVHAMRHFFIPDKVVVLFFLIYRYTWVISAEYDNITRAMKARGFKPRTSVHTYRTVGYLIGSLLVKSYARAENIYKAMRCRGFNGQFWILDHFRISFRDVVAGAAFALYNTVILLVQ
jgi:cobalt/nickel transport system permease protein